MASISYIEDLTCSICLTIFTDPVMLLCGHSFCRECITLSLKSQSQCPQCREDVPKEGTCLPTNHILKSLAEKEAEKLRRGHGSDKEVADHLCPEHEEKLKLFCITDQQLACIICRDGEMHEGHKFKPIKEAAATMMKELEELVNQVSDDVSATESLANTQKEEITKTKERSQQLMTHISRQFEEMHEFLRKRENEIKNNLKEKEEEEVEKMSESLKSMETALSESRELEGKLTSVLEITDSEKFLRSWTENVVAAKRSFRPRKGDLQVVNTCLSLGPYESHLQFFVWKEMLQMIQARAEKLSLRSNNSNVTISADGRNLMYIPKIIQCHKGIPTGYFCINCGSRQVQNGTSYIEDTSVRYASVFSSNKFTSGQHYWEIEVGQRDYWKIGVQNNYLSYIQQKYTTIYGNIKTVLTCTGKPEKIGIYLDCSSKEVSFYDAQTMVHIYTMRECSMSLPVAAYFEYKFSKGADHNPLRVCCY